MVTIAKRRKTRFFALSDESTKKLEAQISAAAIERLPIGDLTPYAKNVKQHPPQKIEQLAENIQTFGFTQPVLIATDNEIIAGHARVEAAKLIGLSVVPVIRLSHLNGMQRRAVRIADNKLAELGEYNLENLRLELIDLTSSELEVGFDPLVLGFDTVEIDRIIEGNNAGNQHDPADALPTIPVAEPAVTQQGDLWICAPHKVLCDNALRSDSYEELMGRDRAQIAFTAPPYNVPNQGHVTKRPSVREFSMADGSLTSAEYIDFLGIGANRIASYVADGAVIYIFIDHRHLDELSAATREIFGKMKNLIVWVKPNAGLGSFYRSQHELIGVYVKGSAAGVNDFKLGARGRHRTNVWRYPGMNSFGRDRDALLALHPTVKPVALVADALRDCSHRGDIVLDPLPVRGRQ
jgi:DNA modification methylase